MIKKYGDRVYYVAAMNNGKEDNYYNFSWKVYSSNFKFADKKAKTSTFKAGTIRKVTDKYVEYSVNKKNGKGYLDSYIYKYTYSTGKTTYLGKY